MKKLILGNLSRQDIQEIVHVTEKGVEAYNWLDTENIEFEYDIERQISDITARLINAQTQLMNEATIWGRAIYPLLILAERGKLQAWSQVPVLATYPHVELSGTIDGVLAPEFAGEITLPYFVVVEAKRGVEAKNPRFQLYGQMLAVAHLHYQKDQQTSQEIFGCYTISDAWTFIRAKVELIDTEKPHLTIEPSREYIEKIEAATILKILNRIIAEVEASSHSECRSR